ncbi:MFS transporter [Arthrobacter sp. ok362]|uniref:MFS transporter n=1 Tax=Arthrobacter sp. ok362 TaxID=1761745 RepID=UPI000884F29E|nr:MFS transporter [Arthrobacter sp. ok362]SDL90421.1 Major Facilitator Superfamily protein [Arthrobacter sp. ok362]
MVHSPCLHRLPTCLLSGRIWLLVLATAAFTGGVMAAFSYISPLLTERTGLPSWAVPVVLVGFGIGSLIGTNLGGRLGDRHPVRTFIGAALVGTIVLALLIPLSGNAAATVVLVVVLGVAGMGVPPVATSLAMRFASNAPTLAAASSLSRAEPRGPTVLKQRWHRLTS